VDSTDGTEPSIARTREEFLNPKPEYFHRGYEWWLMTEAKKRNPKMIFDALQWGVPNWIGNGNFYSQDNADFIVAFIQGAKQYHDIDISFCGGWNEKPPNADWFKLLRNTLNAAGLVQVKVVAADESGHWGISQFSSTTNAHGCWASRSGMVAPFKQCRLTTIA
jgi:galactosylceramidase